MRINDVLEAIQEELSIATSKFGPFASQHEGYAIIKEEVDELWEEIKSKHSPDRRSNIQSEAIQVAAMAVRFLVDLC